jgi:hypothetical protein
LNVRPAFSQLRAALEINDPFTGQAVAKRQFRKVIRHHHTAVAFFDGPSGFVGKPNDSPLRA